jgi:hypothetical protein
VQSRLRVQIGNLQCVFCRKVQGVAGTRRMQLMQRRQVFTSSWSLSVIDMPQLFARFQLASREVNMHLQCGLLGA